MSDSQRIVTPYLAVIDNLSMQVERLKQLLNDPSLRLTTSEAEFQIGGQLSALADELNNLAKEIERTD
jgi:hypothetical protein